MRSDSHALRRINGVPILLVLSVPPDVGVGVDVDVGTDIDIDIYNDVNVDVRNDTAAIALDLKVLIDYKNLIVPQVISAAAFNIVENSAVATQQLMLPLP